MKMPLLSLLLFCALPSAARAEAGLRATICKTGSCACGSVTCACGQVCNSAGCQGAAAAFCQTDSECTASCGDFVCDFDGCKSGTRTVDGGVVAGDGGQSGPMIDGGLAPIGTASPQCGCSSASAVGWLLVIVPSLGLSAAAATGLPALSIDRRNSAVRALAPRAGPPARPMSQNTGRKGSEKYSRPGVQLGILCPLM